LKAKEIPANRLNYLRLLEAISRQELDVRELENLIKMEASVLYRLLRYLNSPMFAFKSEIHSVRHALTILGEHETRRRIRLVTLVSPAMQKSTDMVLSALVRARFCELLAQKVPRTTCDPFLLGLMSMMDAILELPMAKVLEMIPLDQPTKKVLLGCDGPARPIYQLMLAQEVGDWEHAKTYADQLRVSESETGELWWRQCSGRGRSATKPESHRFEKIVKAWLQRCGAAKVRGVLSTSVQNGSDFGLAFDGRSRLA